MELTREKLMSLVHYCPETGIFTWKTREPKRPQDRAKIATWNTRFAGKPAGNLWDGYIKLRIVGGAVHAHRLAWLYMTGEWPKGVIDHIDRNRGNNAFANLRDVSQQVNSLNQPYGKAASGFTGVWQLRSGRFMGRRKRFGKMISVGTFDTAEQAHSALVAANLS